MSSKPVLKIDWATHEAAKFACENWHYSRCVPAGKVVKIGAWENGKFIGVVLFSRGATNEIGSPYALGQTEICELTRIALNKHITPVSKIISIAIKMLKKTNTGIRLIVSYADKNQNHHGGIYQATNWIFCGMAKDYGGSLIINGKQIHGRSVGAKYGTRSLEYIRKHVDKNATFAETSGKYKYLMPLDDEMRKKVQSLAKPYPKRASSKDIVAPDDQSGEGSESLTDALQVSDDAL
jgi:hypothetical protein